MPRVRGGAVLLVASLCFACGGSDGTQASLPWMTEAEYLIGDAPGQGVYFSAPFVRADPRRDRVFVIDPASAQVTVWSGGSLRFMLGGRGVGPGEFISPADLYFEAGDTISVVESSGSRFSYFTAEGNHVRTVLGPGTSVSYQGFRLTLTPPRSDIYVGVPNIPAGVEVGAHGLPPLHRRPLLRIHRTDNGQSQDPEPFLWVDVRNRTLAARFPDGGTSFGIQPFGDADQYRLRPGAAVVMRQRRAPGAVELIDLTAAGDTVWHRHLQFEPRKMTPRVAEDELDRMVDRIAEELSARISRQGLRAVYNEALYRPEYLPTAQEFVLTASGEVWLRTREISDTLRTYYVVRRGDSDGEPRRVLLPESLRISDATATHVWGVGWDSMDVPHIVGRRLVPPGDRD